MNVNNNNEPSGEQRNIPGPPKDPNHEYWQLEFQFKEYLKRMKKDIRKMPYYQLREAMNAFYAGFGVNLVMFEQMSMIGDEATEHQIMRSFLKQIDEHFSNEAERPNLILPSHMN